MLCRCSLRALHHWLMEGQVYLHRFSPMVLSICDCKILRRFDVEIPRGKFAEITSILKGESTWKLWHQFDVDISTWIRLSKSTKYRWVLHAHFLCRFNVKSTLLLYSLFTFYHFLTFSALGTYSKLFWYNAELL